MEIHLTVDDYLKVKGQVEHWPLTYSAFLERVHDGLRKVLIDIDKYMAIELHQEPDYPEWQELYVLARHLNAMKDLIRIYTSDGCDYRNIRDNQSPPMQEPPF